MFGINGGELLIIIVIAMIVVGPERVPDYAQQLRSWAVRGRDYVRRSQADIAREVGGDVDWSTLDPRRYDPRTIVREAFAEEPSTPPTPTPRSASRPATLAEGTPAPYDSEAT